MQTEKLKHGIQCQTLFNTITSCPYVADCCNSGSAMTSVQLDALFLELSFPHQYSPPQFPIFKITVWSVYSATFSLHMMLSCIISPVEYIFADKVFAAGNRTSRRELFCRSSIPRKKKKKRKDSDPTKNFAPHGPYGSDILLKAERYAN